MMRQRARWWLVSLLCLGGLTGCPNNPHEGSLRSFEEARTAAALLQRRGVQVETKSILMVPYLNRWPVTGGERNIAFYAAGLHNVGFRVEVMAAPGPLVTMYGLEGIPTRAPGEIRIRQVDHGQFSQEATHLLHILTAEMRRAQQFAQPRPDPRFIAAAQRSMAKLDALAKAPSNDYQPSFFFTRKADRLAVRALQMRRAMVNGDFDAGIIDLPSDALAATVGLLGTGRHAVWYAQCTTPEAVDDFIALYGQVVTCGQGVREMRFARHLQASVIPNGTDTARFHPTTPESEAPDDMRTGGDDALRIGNVAYLSDRKNQLAIVEACGRRAHALGNFQLYLFGSQDEEGTGYAERIQHTAMHYGIADRLHVMGQRNRIEDYLPHLDIFVFPSKVEGMALAVLEALSSGVPVLASDIPGNRELAGPGVELIDMDRPEALADALEHLASDAEARRVKAQAARKQIDDGPYCISRMIHSMSKLLASLAPHT